jgi:hypothetical protein
VADPHPGWSQGCLLLWLMEQGPTGLEDARWGSHAAVGTWQGTVHFAVSHHWMLLSVDGILSVTDAGRRAMDFYGESARQKMRGQRKSLSDSYWTGVRRGA